MSGDPTPQPLRHGGSRDLGEPWRSPMAALKYLGADFASASAGAGGRPRTNTAAAPDVASGLAAELRLQQTLAAIRTKEELGGRGGAAGIGAGDGSSVSLAGTPRHGIPASRDPAGRQLALPPAPGSAAVEPMGDALAADYRAQLQRYVAQLAAKDAEAAALRLQAGELKQQLASTEGRATHASEQLSRQAMAVGQLEQATASLEHQLAEREAELQAAQVARRTAEQAAAAAKAQAAAVQKSAGTKSGEFEQQRRYFQEQLERRDAELHSLEDALRKQAAELDKRSREWAQREAELSATHSKSHGTAAAVQAELGVAQDKLDAAVKRVRVLEGDNAELRRQKAQLTADLRMLEELLADSDAERRELHDKFLRLGERMEALVKEGKVLKSSAMSETGAARTAVQEALKDAEAAVRERAMLLAKVQQLQAKLEEEQAGRSALKDRVQKKLAAAEQEVSMLRGELEVKAKQLQELQAGMKALQADAEGKLAACEKQMLTLKDRAAALKGEAEAERQRSSKAIAEAESLCQERCKVELQQQALKYERRIQELELGPGRTGLVGGGQGSPGPMRGSVLDYIPRAEHVRLLETRLAAKEGDMQLELQSRVAQAEREWQWKLESKDQEISSLTTRTRQLEDDLHTERQRASSQAHKLSDEGKRLGAQCLELQRELEAQNKEVARLKELLKDARSANADMDDDAMNSSRTVARLRHAVEDSQHALKEAQAALGQERKRCEEIQREAEAQAAKVADAGRRADRLVAEVGELQAALEQKQELITALQAESDAWSAKLMAHREFHEREVDGLRQQLREEGDARAAALEERSQALAAELREAKQQHEEMLGQLRQQYTAQVAQLETQLVAAERCSEELREVTARLGSVRSEDVEALKSAVNELQLRLRESEREQERLRRQYTAQLSAIAGQVRAKMAALQQRSSSRQSAPSGSPLRQQTTTAAESQDVAAACAECLSAYESELAAAQRQLQLQGSALDGRHADLAAQVTHLRSNLRQLLEALEAEAPGLPASVLATLLDNSGGASTDHQVQQAVAAAQQQMAAAAQQHMEQAAAAAVDSALVALEAQLLPAASTAGPNSPRKLLLSPTRRFERGAAQTGAPSMDANESRLAALMARSRELVSQLGAGEAAMGQLRQQLARLEAAEASYAAKFGQVKAEAQQVAEAARSTAVAPLQAEVARLMERVQGLQQLHRSELAAIEAAARQQAAAAQADAQATIDRMAAAGGKVQRELRSEAQRAEGLAADLARTQDELAKHTQRAATKIELQEGELEMLKGRIREMEAREAASLQDLRGLRQREAAAAAALGPSGSGSSSGLSLQLPARGL